MLLKNINFWVGILNGEDYPKHKEWYFHKQIPRIFTPSGEILFARSEEDENKIIAMACLKKDEEEQKIYTLYVSSHVEDNV